MSVFIFLGLHAQEPFDNSQKINGLSICGPSSAPFTNQMFDFTKVPNVNCLAFTPHATLERISLKLVSDQNQNWWSQSIPGTIAGITLAKGKGYKVMLKPQIVLEEIKSDQGKLAYLFSLFNDPDKTNQATWRGDFKAKNERDWQIWEQQYENYILRFAHLADSLDVDLFCIGTELRESVINRPQFWRQLIKKVRIVYKGPLTYSANWDEYQQVSFWDELDQIGVNAYFPVSQSVTPDIEATLDCWQIIIDQLNAVCKKYDRPLLITEFGYQNVNYAGKEPWTHQYDHSSLNYQSQSNLYEAFFQAFWNKSWVKGAFLWQWLPSPLDQTKIHFTPQNKPAMKILQSWYQ